eukprot:TRINITY_DN30855_c0_g1_i1.p1 TRINITY_DN30855_c0_g1~~TRINITY_DN30855_c0_g1_i1.p1  ORF type:complete len:172 (-),score=19.64 TRINITY_DN30855_c0_g1_i1:87-602(-)
MFNGKFYTFTDADVQCPNVLPCNLFSRKSVSHQPSLGFPPGMETVDSWMELPLATKHLAEQQGGSSKQKYSKQHGKGKVNTAHSSSSQSTGDKLTDKALLNLDARMRTQEDITEDALDVPASLEAIETALRVGPNYDMRRPTKAKRSDRRIPIFGQLSVRRWLNNLTALPN